MVRESGIIFHPGHVVEWACSTPLLDVLVALMASSTASRALRIAMFDFLCILFAGLALAAPGPGRWVLVALSFFFGALWIAVRTLRLGSSMS